MHLELQAVRSVTSGVGAYRLAELFCDVQKSFGDLLAGDWILILGADDLAKGLFQKKAI